MTWKPGEKKELAKRAGITAAHLSQIITRRSRPRAEVAKRLAEACSAMGIRISYEEWMTSKETRNGMFQGDPA